jgi:hypothetical protein
MNATVRDDQNLCGQLPQIALKMMGLKKYMIVWEAPSYLLIWGRYPVRAENRKLLPQNLKRISISWYGLQRDENWLALSFFGTGSVAASRFCLSVPFDEDSVWNKRKR